MKHRLRNLLIACAAAGLLVASRQARGQVTPAEGYTPPDDEPKVNIGGVSVRPAPMVPVLTGLRLTGSTTAIIT